MATGRDRVDIRKGLEELWRRALKLGRTVTQQPQAFTSGANVSDDKEKSVGKDSVSKFN